MGTIKTNLAKVYILYIHTHTHIYINIIMFSTIILTCLSIISLSQSKVSRNSTIIITPSSSEPLNKKYAQETVQLSSSALSSSSIIGLSSLSSNNNDKEGEIDVIKKEIIKVENSNNHEKKEEANGNNNSAHINNYIRSISSITINKERKLDEEDGDNDNNNLDLNDVVGKANDIYEKTSNIYNKTSETVGDVKETLDTAPTSWTKSQWTIIGILIAVGLVAFGCIYRCIPCTPRII